MMPTTTRASAETAAYTHSLETLLGLAPDSDVHKALQAAGLNQFALLSNLEADDMDALTYPINEELPPTTGSLNLGQKKNLMLLKWFYVIRWQQAHNDGDTFTPSDWLLLTLEEFTTFQSQYGATIKRYMTQDEVVQAILGVPDLFPDPTSLPTTAPTSSSDDLAVSNFQNYMTKYQEIRDYAPNQAKAMDDGEKIALLNACVGNDPRFAPIQTTVNTLTKMGGGKSLTYPDYLEQLIDASIRMEPTGRPPGPNPLLSNSFDSSKDSPDNDGAWKTDMGKQVPAAVAAAHDAQSATGSATTDNVPNTVTLASLLGMQINDDLTMLTEPTTDNTNLTFRQILSSCCQTAASPAVPASVATRPSIRDIMSSGRIPTNAPTVLTPGNYQDSTGRTFIIN
jgi:hypothetical protein